MAVLRCFPAHLSVPHLLRQDLRAQADQHDAGYHSFPRVPGRRADTRIIYHGSDKIHRRGKRELCRFVDGNPGDTLSSCER